MSYAEKTTVPVSKSRAQIEDILTRAGALRIATSIEPTLAMIAFELNGRFVRFELRLPHRGEFKTLPQWEQSGRSRWRALRLCIKAKLEAVEQGITSFDQEFLAHIVVSGGRTLGQIAIPQIEESYSNGKPPRLLLEQ